MPCSRLDRAGNSKKETKLKPLTFPWAHGLLYEHETTKISHFFFISQCLLFQVIFCFSLAMRLVPLLRLTHPTEECTGVCVVTPVVCLAKYLWQWPKWGTYCKNRTSSFHSFFICSHFANQGLPEPEWSTLYLISTGGFPFCDSPSLKPSVNVLNPQCLAVRTSTMQQWCVWRGSFLYFAFKPAPWCFHLMFPSSFAGSDNNKLVSLSTTHDVADHAQREKKYSVKS